MTQAEREERNGLRIKEGKRNGRGEGFSRRQTGKISALRLMGSG